MKILILCYFAYPHVGGVSTFIDILKSELPSRGHETDIVAYHPQFRSLYRVSDQKKVSMVALRESRRGSGNRCWTAWRKREMDAFQEGLKRFDLNRYDVVFTQDIYSAQAARKILPEHTPLVTMVHGNLQREWLINREIRWRSEAEKGYLHHCEKNGLNAGDRLIVPSRWLKRYVRQTYGLRRHIDVVSYGIDGFAFKRGTKKRRAGRPPLIFTPARLVPVKGHRVLLQALAIVKQKRIRFSCVLAGDGYLRSELEQEAIRLGLNEQVIFLGDRRDVREWLLQSDIMVLPSLHDTFPFVIMEGQMASSAVIATRTGGIPEMIEHGQTGLLTTPGSPEDLARRLLQVLTDEQLRTRLAKEARDHALKRWNQQRMIREIENILLAARAGTVKTQVQSDPMLRDRTTSALKWKANLCGTVAGRVMEPGKSGGRHRVHLLDYNNVVLMTRRITHRGHFQFFRVPYGNYSLVLDTGDQSKTVKITVRGNACHHFVLD